MSTKTISHTRRSSKSSSATPFEASFDSTLTIGSRLGNQLRIHGLSDQARSTSPPAILRRKRRYQSFHSHQRSAFSPQLSSQQPSQDPSCTTLGTNQAASPRASPPKRAHQRQLEHEFIHSAVPSPRSDTSHATLESEAELATIFMEAAERLKVREDDYKQSKHLQGSQARASHRESSEPKLHSHDKACNYNRLLKWAKELVRNSVDIAKIVDEIQSRHLELLCLERTAVFPLKTVNARKKLGDDADDDFYKKLRLDDNWVRREEILQEQKEYNSYLHELARKSKKGLFQLQSRVGSMDLSKTTT